MKTILLTLILTLQGTAIFADRHVTFNSPGSEGSGWKWNPVTLTDAESELLSKRSDSPKTALDYYLLLSGNYFRNISSETNRRITFIDQETLSDKYLHAKYTIPSVDAGGFWLTIRLFGEEDDPLIAVSHRGGSKRLLAAKQNGPQGLWSVQLNRPSIWRYRGGAFSEGGAFVRAPESVMPEISVDRILEHYRSHYLPLHGKVDVIPLGCALPQEGNKVKVTRGSERYVWAEYVYKEGKFELTMPAKQGSSGQAATDAEPQASAAQSRFSETSRFIFHSILEGLYEDGVSTEDVERILMKREDEYHFHFIYACPVCTPSIWAFEAYHLRTEKLHFVKSGASTFGFGLETKIRDALHSDDVKQRLSAINTLIGRWIDRRMDKLRLTEEERAELTERLEEKREERLGSRSGEPLPCMPPHTKAGKNGNAPCVAPPLASQWNSARTRLLNPNQMTLISSKVNSQTHL